MIRVADYIMFKLQQEGVGHLFYVPGGQCVYLTDALRRNEHLEGIAVHHEQAAAMAALSYSLYNNHMGACLVTTGCAGTNTMTGVLHAWQDSIPCIFISGQQNVGQTVACSGLPLRQVGVQEANIAGLVTPITKYAHMLDKAEEVCYHVEKALYLAKEGRKGPVWIDVPLDIQNAMIDMDLENGEDGLKHFTPPQEAPAVPSAEEMEYAVSCLKAAQRPVIIAGQGIRSAKAAETLNAVAGRFRIPVVFTRFSIDLMDYRNEMNFGVVGSAGANREANFIVQNSDLVLSIGSRLSIDTTGPQRDDFARAAKIIVVDIDEVEHSKKGVRIDKLILADAGIFLSRLLEENVRATEEKWVEKCRHWKQIFNQIEEASVSGGSSAGEGSSIIEEAGVIKEAGAGEKSGTAGTGKKRSGLLDMKHFLKQCSLRFPENSVLLSDAGMTGCAVPAVCHLKESDRLIHSFAQGEMGFVLPGAIGAAPISRGMVFAITGDGSFMMNLQELQTVARNQYNIKMIIINNNGYSGVRHGQKAHFRGKSIGTDPSNGVDFPDYGKVADAFGIAYAKIEDSTQMEEELDKMIQTDRPYMLEVMCDPEQFDYHNALVMYGRRKFGFRPIEDQSPFLDREVFFGEMIVEPMETSYGKPM